MCKDTQKGEWLIWMDWSIPQTSANSIHCIQCHKSKQRTMQVHPYFFWELKNKFYGAIKGKI